MGNDEGRWCVMNPVEEHGEEAMTSGCIGLGSLLFVMGYCGMKYGFWGAVMGTGLGLLAFLVVTEIFYRLLVRIND